MWLVAPVSAFQSVEASTMRGERGLDGSKCEVLAFPAKAAASAPSEASSATLAFSLPFFCASIASARFVSSLARVQQCSRVCPFLFLHMGVEVYALALDLPLFFVLFVCLCLSLSYAPFAPQSSFMCPLLFPIHF